MAEGRARLSTVCAAHPPEAWGADDNEQARIVEDAGEVQNAWERSSGWREATEQLLRDSEGSTASLYGLWAAVLGDAQSSQPGTNADARPTDGALDRLPSAHPQDTALPLRSAP
ncbi:hypothetical protein OPT61_g7844 [Boeremia exigua]|uniref:Uncharacterized protein n=1 Tax=Boeremia exigua TaxID=749465 RepID=A0ACC2I0Y0_9PLEO|nr:hypothetical protein OPT61_g7844 [Boeremia exigua]